MTVVHHATKYIYSTRYILYICYIVLYVSNYVITHAANTIVLCKLSHLKNGLSPEARIKKGQTSQKGNHHLVQTRRKNNKTNKSLTESTSPPFQNLGPKKMRILEHLEPDGKFVIICHIISYPYSYPCKFELVAKKIHHVHPIFFRLQICFRSSHHPSPPQGFIQIPRTIGSCKHHHLTTGTR